MLMYLYQFKKGFTLLELLIVLSIVGIISLFSMASYSLLLEKNEEQIIVDDIKSAIHYARIQAVSYGHQVTLTPLDAHSDWSKGIKITQLDKKTNKELVVHQWQWPRRKWSLIWSGVNSEKIIFSNNPVNAISNGTFTLSSLPSKKKKIIVLNRIGRIRVE